MQFRKKWRINAPLVLAKYNQFISKSFISIISQFDQQHEISQEREFRYTKVALDIWYQKGRYKRKNCISLFGPQIVIAYANNLDSYGKYLLYKTSGQGLF